MPPAKRAGRAEFKQSGNPSHPIALRETKQLDLSLCAARRWGKEAGAVLRFCIAPNPLARGTPDRDWIASTLLYLSRCDYVAVVEFGLRSAVCLCLSRLVSGVVRFACLPSALCCTAPFMRVEPLLAARCGAVQQVVCCTTHHDPLPRRAACLLVVCLTLDRDVTRDSRAANQQWRLDFAWAGRGGWDGIGTGMVRWGHEKKNKRRPRNTDGLHVYVLLSSPPIIIIVVDV